jgi:hypothetical protein
MSRCGDIAARSSHVLNPISVSSAADMVDAVLLRVVSAGAALLAVLPEKAAKIMVNEELGDACGRHSGTCRAVKPWVGRLWASCRTMLWAVTLCLGTDAPDLAPAFRTTCGSCWWRSMSGG